MLGYEKIPDFWKSGIPALADTKFQYTNYSYNEICKSTLNRARTIIKQAGGKIEGDEAIIPDQKPIPAKLEEYNPGIPDKQIDTKDPSWIWKGNWADGSLSISGSGGQKTGAKSADGAGAEATLMFTGSAVFVLGINSQSGGRADVYLDGKKQRRLNAYIVERTNDDVLWHVYGLKQGPHTLKIVTRDDADPRSKGKRIAISSAVVYCEAAR